MDGTFLEGGGGWSHVLKVWVRPGFCCQNNFEFCYRAEWVSQSWAFPNWNRGMAHRRCLESIQR